jgi:hypothetical protein
MVAEADEVKPNGGDSKKSLSMNFTNHFLRDSRNMAHTLRESLISAPGIVVDESIPRIIHRGWVS